MSNQGQPPAGWYPDPQVPGQQRYWDGTQWTQTAPAAPAAAYGAAPTPPKKTGGKTWLIPLVACLSLAVIAVVIAAVASSGGDDDAGVTADSPSVTQATDEAEQATTTTVEEATTTAPKAKPVAVTGFTKYDALGETWVSVGIVLTHLTGGSQELTVSLLDAAGTPIATNTEYVGWDGDGGEVLVSSMFADNAPNVADVRVDITNASMLVDAKPFPVTVTSQSVDQNLGGLWTIKGTAKNEGSENISIGKINCVAFKAGKPVAGAATIADTMVPGAEVAWDATSTFDPHADEVRCQGEA
jgi:hypothetical protein